VSQELLGTDEVLVIGHTHCGLEGQTDQAIRDALIARTGRDVPLEFGSFPDIAASVRSQVERIRTHPWTKDVAVHGLIFDVETGGLREVV
jgi:carbonic anhydrase